MAACDYANARAAARRARLPGPAGAVDVASRASAEERVAALRATPFGPALAAALDRGLALSDAVDQATAAHAAAAARDAARFLGGRARALFLEVLLLDAAADLKAVLRAHAGGAAAVWALPSPALPEAAIRAVAAVPPEQAADALAAAGSPLAPCLAAALARRGAETGLLHLEAALDREVSDAVAARLRRAVGADAAVARRALARHADRANARVLLALGDAKPSPDLLVHRGALAPRLDAIAALPLEERILRIARALSTRRHPLHPEDLAEPARAESALAAIGEHVLAEEARAEPLSIAVPLAWVAAVRADARRLRVLARGGDFGMPAAELIELVEA